jgi:hypothetical protein
VSARFHWLLDVQIGERLYRWSVEDVTVTNADGDDLEYRAGLRDEDRGQGDPDVDVEVLDASVDWPRVGPLLDGAPCVLRRWREGDVIEQAEVYSRGTVAEPEWETAQDPASWDIVQVLDLPPFPDAAAKVSDVTTETSEADGSEIPPDQSGMYYPVVFGHPGRLVRQYSGAEIGPDSGLLITMEPVVPCPMRIRFEGAATYPDSQIVISADAGACLPDWVKVRENGLGAEGVLTVRAATDELGRRIGVATLEEDLTLMAWGDDGPEYLAAYGPFEDSTEGEIGGGGTQAPREAYDVLVYCLERWGGNSVDWGRIPEIRDWIRGFYVDTWANEDVPGGIWEWFVSALGVGAMGSTESAGLPIAIRQGVDGRYFVPLIYATDPARTVRTIDVARGEAVRIDGLSVDGDPVNVLEIHYGYDLSTWAGETAGNVPAVIAATGTIGTTQLTTTLPSGLATLSLARYGPRIETLDVPWTWDHGTALRVAEVVLQRDAIPWIRTRYRVPEAWGLREGDQIRIVDPDVGLDDLAIVHGPPLVGSPEGAAVTLRFRRLG